jgi:translocator protein
MRSIMTLLPFAVAVAAAAVTGSQFMPGDWYISLNKPAWTPPGWLFPIAWTILYVMIAVAGWLAWKAGGFGSAVAIWTVGLALNALWSYVMFGRHEIGWALVNIAALWLFIALFIWTAWPLDRRAAWLFVPYLAWVSFAAALNAAIYMLNR